MRIAVWAYAATVVFVCLVVPLLCGMSEWIYFYWREGKPLPNLTLFFLAYRWYTLGTAVPWLGTAVWLSRRGNTTPDRVFAYAGISTFAIVFILAVTAIAILLPFVPMLDLRGFHL